MSDPNSIPIAPQGVARKTVHGAVALGVRQILVQGTRILGGIFLARLLTPGEFGIYAIVLYLQTFLTAFGDAGLAASLIRQPNEPQTADYQLVFTFQQILVVGIALGMWLLSPWIASRYHLEVGDAWLFRLVALSFVVTSFMVIPLVRLERHLAFHKVAVIESAQAIVFNVAAVYFAWRGRGAYAFVWALLLRSLVGTALANWISPWRVGWRWDWSMIRAHMSFGLPYQGIQVISLLKDSIAPIFIGFLLGTADVGYITWANMIAAYPVLILFVLQRLYMPAFARLQNHRAQLIALAENVIWATNAIAAPLAILTLVMIVPITTLVYGTKWLVALPYFYLFWGANLFVPSATPAMGLLNALGKSKIALLFAFIWMAGTWIIGAPLILLYGAIGFAIANLVVMFSAFWLYRAAQRQVPFRLLPVIAPVWVIAAISGIFVDLICRQHAPLHILTVVLYGTVGLLVHGSGLYLFYKGKMKAVWSSLRATE
ncbi:MAG: oligosaccharide flippase family protein [Acidobacteriaceae bacterium]